MSRYDVIVLGIGGVGSAALWRLAKRGLSVLGIDQFDPPHDQGSSHAQTRIIRQAYFEHPDYVPLAQRAYELWDELETAMSRRLRERTGLVQVGPRDGVVLSGVRRAADEHGLEVEELTAAEVVNRWPAFHVPDGLVGVYEATGGFLHVERCVQACLEAARQRGAETLVNTRVLGWTSGVDRLTVATDRGEFSSERLIVTAGPWASRLLKGLDLKLQVRRKSLFWFAQQGGHALGDLPPYLFELPSGVFYGFPAIDELGVKVGDHSVGQPLDSPEEIDRSVFPEEEHAVRSFLRERLPGVSEQCSGHSTCFYTMSPDEHFFVDRHPDDHRVAFAAGLSGHGFKFTPVLGDALADLVTEGDSALPIGFLALR